MKRKCRILGHAVAAGWLMLWCHGAFGQDAPAKKRVAVLNFDNPSLGADAPSGLFGADGEDVGKGVSALLIQKLIEGGKYTVVDRSALAKVLKEQSEEEKDRVDAYGMAARVGRILQLDAMIVGAITQYGPESKQANASGGGFGMHTRKSKAYVEITAEVLNISTGAIMADFKGTGESSRVGEISIMSSRGHAKSSVEILGSEFVESLLPEATSSADRRATRHVRGKNPDPANRSRCPRGGSCGKYPDAERGEEVWTQNRAAVGGFAGGSGFHGFRRVNGCTAFAAEHWPGHDYGIRR
jgi:curli biogenesis system outer membrane secretion channel CsgG